MVEAEHIKSTARYVISFLAQLVERVTSNDEVSRSSRLMGSASKGLLFVFVFCFPSSQLLT